MFRTTAMSAASLAAGVTAALVTAAPAAADSYACHVNYRPTISANTLTANIVIWNVGEFTINGWTLRFDLPAGQTLIGGRRAIFTQTGTEVTGVNLEHNGVLEPENSVTPKITVTGGDLTARPANFKVNGVPCTT